MGNIPKNEIINKNIEKLLSKEFTKEFRGICETFDKRGKMQYSFVNAHYNNCGEIKEFGNHSSNQIYKGVTFNIDVSYFFNPGYLKFLGFAKNKWTVDDVYFDNEKNEDVKSVIEDAVKYVNKMPVNERNQHKKDK